MVKYQPVSLNIYDIFFDLGDFKDKGAIVFTSGSAKEIKEITELKTGFIKVPLIAINTCNSHKVFTSCYTDVKKLPKEMIKKFVSISNGTADGFENIDKIQELVPPWDIVDGYKKGVISEEQYEKVYREHVECLFTDSFIESLQGRILLCFCRKGNFCHRHIVADILKEHGIICEEI